MAVLKLSVPEARVVLEDLKEWMSTQYFLYASAEAPSAVQTSVKEYRIYIFMNMDPLQVSQPNCYAIRRLIDAESSYGKGARVVTERYLETWLKNEETVSGSTGLDEMPYWMGAKILYITKVYQTFIDRLEEM